MNKPLDKVCQVIKIQINKNLIIKKNSKLFKTVKLEIIQIKSNSKHNKNRKIKKK